MENAMANLKQQHPEKKGFFSRWFESIAESRMRQAMGEGGLDPHTLDMIRQGHADDEAEEKKRTSH
jgi:hypothetical protein